MDTLEEKVSAVREVFRQLDQEITQFQSWSSLSCPSGCGRCCFKSDIEATVLEFLPFAHVLFRAGKTSEWLDRLQAAGTQCLILDPGQSGVGLCTEYAHRGLICRLFGYSARTNKYGKPELVTCTTIKTNQREAFESVQKQMEEGKEVPVMSDYYMRLRSVDPNLAGNFYPINEAIRRAIETVLQYYAYRE
jgi:Fe-S-cluster containining protein